MLLLSNRAVAQGTYPASTGVAGLEAQRFELGFTGSVAFTDLDEKYHGDDSTKVFGCRLDAGAEQVPTSLTADLVASSLSGSGTGVLGGVVHLPACVSVGTSMQVGIAVAPGPSTAWLGNEVIAATVPINTNGLRYLISGLSDGQYILFMRLDSNHDGKFGTGDYAGYVGGTVSAPILDPGASASVVVSSTQPGSASFGLGTL